MPAVVTASRGIGSFEERNVPSAHISAEQMTMSTPVTVAPAPGRRRTATPTNPKTVPASEAPAGRSPVSERKTTSQSGTEAKISAASPIGTRRSATNSRAFAPIRSTPQRTVDETVAQPSRNGAMPCRTIIQLVSRIPTAVKRSPAAKSGGIVSPASSMPRYVEPQTMYTVHSASHARELIA